MIVIKFFRKNKFMILAALFMAVIITSCQNNEELALKTMQLSGASEAPPNNSTGSGTVEGNYNSKTKIVSLTIKWSLGNASDTTTMGHIHKGAVGESGPVVIPFVGLPSGSKDQEYHFTSEPLTTEQEADLKAGNYYANIHSSAHPAGELRAQLVLE